MQVLGEKISRVFYTCIHKGRFKVWTRLVVRIILVRIILRVERMGESYIIGEVKFSLSGKNGGYNELARS